MNTVWLGLAIYAVLVACIIRCNRRSYDRVFTISLASFFTGLLLAIATAITGLVINDHLPMKTVESGPFTLVAMRGTDGAAGNFVYGCGTIAGARYYNVMVRNEDGSMSGYVLAGDNTTSIFETSDLRDHGEWKLKTVSHDYSGEWGSWAFGDAYAKYYNILLVPTGTVVHDFSVK